MRAHGWIHHVIRFVVWAGASSALAACSGDPPPSGPACAAYDPPSGFDAAHPAVHFRADVMPIFIQSCAFASCHGARSGLAGGLYLGSKDNATDPAEVRRGLVGVPSPELSSMSLVTAADPKASYLMHKLDADACTFNAQCKDRNCGDTMPQSGDPLPVAERDVVRRWIAQGALDD